MDTQPDRAVVLTEVERALVRCVVRGEVLDLASNEAVDGAATRSWDESQTVRACVVRDILLGRLASDPDPHGLRLRGARIAGRLDLENVKSEVWLEFFECLLTEGLISRDAHLPGLTLMGCRLEHPREPPLDLERFTTAVLDLADTTVLARAPRGAINASFGRFQAIACGGTTLRNDCGPALNADRLHVEQDVFLGDEFEAVGSGELGAVRLAGAHMGRLDCTSAVLHNESGPALNAEGMEVDQSVFLHDGFEAVSASEERLHNLSARRSHRRAPQCERCSNDQ